MLRKKKKGDNRFIEDDPDSLEFFSSEITNEERKRAEQEWRELTNK